MRSSRGPEASLWQRMIAGVNADRFVDKSFSGALPTSPSTSSEDEADSDDEIWRVDPEKPSLTPAEDVPRRLSDHGSNETIPFVLPGKRSTWQSSSDASEPGPGPGPESPRPQPYDNISGVRTVTSPSKKNHSKPSSSKTRAHARCCPVETCANHTVPFAGSESLDSHLYHAHGLSARTNKTVYHNEDDEDF